MAKFMDYIGRAWSLYWANFLQIFLAMLLILAVSILLIVVMVFAIEIDTTIGILLSVVLLLLLTPFSASFYGMAAEAVKTGKTSLGTLFSTFRGKAVTLLGVQLASMALMLLPILVVLAISMGFASLGIISLGIISLAIILVAVLVMFVVSILFLLALPSAVCDDTGVIQSIKNSFAIVKANPGSLFAVWLTYIVLSLVISLIPILGTIVSLFLISPMMEIAITDFYMRNKAKPAGAAKAPAKTPAEAPKSPAKTGTEAAVKATKTKAKTKAKKIRG